eukprot:g25371.t1
MEEPSTSVQKIREKDLQQASARNVEWTTSWLPSVVPSVADISLQLIHFSHCDIKKWLEVLVTAKAMDPDNILAIVLKTCAPELATPLAKLFQYSYDTEVYPTMCKAMEDVINSAIKQHLHSNNLLSDAQFRFHQGHSAPDLTRTLVQTWTKDLNSR